MKLQIKWVKVVKKTNRFQIKSEISHYKFWIQPRCFSSSSIFVINFTINPKRETEDNVRGKDFTMKYIITRSIRNQKTIKSWR